MSFHILPCRQTLLSRPLAAAAFLLSASINANAITNIESQRLNGVTEGLSGNIKFSLAGKSGNTDKQSSTAYALADYLQEKNEWLAIARLEYGQTSGNRDVNNKFYHGRYIYHLNDRFAWEGFLQYQTDEFKFLRSRSLEGGGARWTLYQSDAQLLALGTGAYYTQERFNLSTGEPTDDYARANFYLTYKYAISPTSQLSNTAYFQPRFSDTSDYYASNSLALTVKINNRLALELNVETQYDNKPVDNLKKTDQNYTTSLVYSF